MSLGIRSGPRSHLPKRTARPALTVQQTYSFESDATRGAPEGWKQTLDRLTDFVAKA